MQEKILLQILVTLFLTITVCTSLFVKQFIAETERAKYQRLLHLFY